LGRLPSLGGMTYRLSRLMSAATASYGVYALAQPRHLGSALAESRKEQARYDVLARTYGARDLATSALGVLGRSERTVRAAMLLRIAGDLSDAAILSRETSDPAVRQKVLAVTLGWASLNALALLVDSRRAKR
jgi:hypothetical protein